MDMLEVDDVLRKLDGGFVRSLRAQFDKYRSIREEVDHSFHVAEDSRSSVDRTAAKTQEAISGWVVESVTASEKIPVACEQYRDKGRELECERQDDKQGGDCEFE